MAAIDSPETAVDLPRQWHALSDHAGAMFGSIVCDCEKQAELAERILADHDARRDAHLIEVLDSMDTGPEAAELRERLLVRPDQEPYVAPTEVELSDEDIRRIDDFMNSHMRGHRNSNSPYGHVCDEGCRRWALARAVKPVLAEHQAEAGRAAVLVAADAIQDLHPGEVKNSVVFLRDFASKSHVPST